MVRTHDQFAYLLSFTIQVAEFAIFRYNFSRVDLRVMSEHIFPPGHVINLLQVDEDSFLVL